MVFTLLWEAFRFSSDDIGRMTRREIDWRVKMAAEKMKRRVKASTVEETTEFTDKEKETLDRGLKDAEQRVKARFQK